MTNREKLLSNDLALMCTETAFEPSATRRNPYDFAKFACCTINESGAILQGNMAAAKLLGVALDELPNRSFSSFVSKEDRDRHFRHIQRIPASGEQYFYEIRMLGGDGSEFRGRLAVNTAQDKNGIRTICIVLTNIAERKMAEVTLHGSEQFTQAVLDAISFQIAVLNHEGIIVAVNEVWRKFAVENSDVPGLAARCTQIGVNYLAECRGSRGVSSEGGMDAVDGIQAVLEGQLPGFNLDYPCHSATQRRWFTLSVTPLGKRGVVITHAEITARKEAEEHLARHYDAVVREAHHRIKNSLQGVAGLLQREQGKFAGGDLPLAVAISQVNAVAMVHALQAANPAEITRLCESVSHICTMVSELAQHPVSFQIEDRHTFRTVQIGGNERVPVALVLNELILNAVKHSPDDGKPPVVSLQADGINAWVRIRNTVACPPAFCLATGKGLGTGLSLVRSLLPKRGAYLDYELDQPDSMLATLRLTAPAVEAAIT